MLKWLPSVGKCAERSRTILDLLSNWEPKKKKDILTIPRKNNERKTKKVTKLP